MFLAWRDYERFGTLPLSGGWLAQPLDLLVQLQAIDTVVGTYRYKNAKDADWNKLTATQREIIRQLDAEL